MQYIYIYISVRMYAIMHCKKGLSIESTKNELTELNMGVNEREQPTLQVTSF